MIALLAEVGASHAVLLEMKLFLFPSQSAGQRAGDCDLKLFAKFSKHREIKGGRGRDGEGGKEREGRRGRGEGKMNTAL